MSWQTYVDDHLMCDIDGYGNSLTAAAIVGHDGNVLAQSSSFPRFKHEEIIAIMGEFDEPGSLAPTGLYLGGTKYMVIQGEAGAVIRGKKMAFTGTGGRWHRGGGTRYFKEEPFELFPDIELPERRKLTEEDRELLMWDLKLQNYWKTSPYNLDEEKSEDVDIERYSDRAKKRQRLSRQPLSSYLNLEPGYFPRDLLPGVKSSGVRKMKCKQNIDLQLDQLFDKFEKKEQELKSGKESEDDEKDEDEEIGDFGNDDDYEQGLKSEKESEDEDEESGDFSDDDGDYEQDQELKSGKESEDYEKDEDEESGDFNNDEDYEQGSGGITVKKTGQALIFGIYDEPVTPGQCNKAVEKLGDYLIEQGL